MKPADVRRAALALPEAAEEPHFDTNSFRIRGKIFATLPPDGKHVHIFVGEAEREIMSTTAPDSWERLWWGKKVVGLRAQLDRAAVRDVKKMLAAAWRRKAPKALIESTP